MTLCDMAPSRHIILVAVLMVLGEDSHRGTQWSRTQDPEGLQVEGMVSGRWLLRKDFLGELAVRQGGPVWAGRECGVQMGCLS